MSLLPHLDVICHPRFPYGNVLRRALGPSRLPPPLDGENVRFYMRGSTALRSGLSLLGLSGADSVLFPSYHCGIELDVILKAGIRAAFYPVDASLRVDTDSLGRCLDSTTKALYVIHYFGFPHDLDELRRFCDRHGLFLIEDCAQSLYGRYRGEPVGTVADIAIYSLSKTLAMPGGGALIVNNAGLHSPPDADPRSSAVDIRVMRLIVERDLLVGPRFLDWAVRQVIFGSLSRIKKVFSSWASGKGPSEGDHVANGCLRDPFEFRLEWENAGVSALAFWLLGRMPHEWPAEARRRNFEYLSGIVGSCRSVRPLLADLPDGACPAYYPVIPDGDPALFINFLRERGIWADFFWKRVHPSFPANGFPDMIRLKNNIVILPVHQSLRAKDLILIQDGLLEWERLHARVSGPHAVACRETGCFAI